MSLEPIANSNSVFPAVFIAQEDYQLSKALLWGICSKHLDVTWNSANSLPQRAIHGILFVIECVPILGQIVSLVEYVIAKTLGFITKDTKSQPLTSNNTQPNSNEEKLIKSKIDRPQTIKTQKNSTFSANHFPPKVAETLKNACEEHLKKPETEKLLKTHPQARIKYEITRKFSKESKIFYAKNNSTLFKINKKEDAQQEFNQYINRIEKDELTYLVKNNWQNDCSYKIKVTITHNTIDQQTYVSFSYPYAILQNGDIQPSKGAES